MGTKSDCSLTMMLGEMTIKMVKGFQVVRLQWYLAAYCTFLTLFRSRRPMLVPLYLGTVKSYLGMEWTVQCCRFSDKANGSWAVNQEKLSILRTKLPSFAKQTRFVAFVTSIWRCLDWAVHRSQAGRPNILEIKLNDFVISIKSCIVFSIVSSMAFHLLPSRTPGMGTRMAGSCRSVRQLSLIWCCHKENHTN